MGMSPECIGEIAYVDTARPGTDFEQSRDLELDAGQPISVHAARVQADLVREIQQQLPTRRMAEADGVLQRVPPTDELVSDPQQIFVALLVEIAPGVDAGVDH
jgi:hypothetical protein